MAIKKVQDDFGALAIFIRGVIALAIVVGNDQLIPLSGVVGLSISVGVVVVAILVRTP